MKEKQFDREIFDISKYDDAEECGFEEYKSIIFNRIHGIYIDKFRTLEDRYIPLGHNLTIISGKNGTMKSTLLGLIAHPFSSEAEDFFGSNLKTDMRNVFNLSIEKDLDDYLYYLHAESNNNIEFCEPIRVYFRNNDKETRHRITVGKDNKAGKGNFYLNTSYLNLKRLYPIVDTKPKKSKISIPDKYNDFISSTYFRLLQNNHFDKSEPIEDKKIKNTFGPVDSFYNYESISTGEDNIGYLINKLCSFEENKTPDIGSSLQGILCIDEIEAGLHPIAQEKLLNLLLEWSKKHNVQIVFTTHSLYLIQCALELQNKSKDNSIIINMISTQMCSNNNYTIITNPNYELAYKELTFKDSKNNESIFKPTIFLEDEIAINFLKKILKNRDIINNLNFITGGSLDANNKGLPYLAMISLIKNGNWYFNDAVFVLDPDVSENVFQEVKDKNARILKLPSLYGLCIEKEIVKFIYDLPNDNKLFSELKEEKMSILATFGDYQITTFDIESLSPEKCSAKPFKNWQNNHKSIFNKALLYYRNELYKTESYHEFYHEFIGYLNSIYESFSLPKLNF